MVEWPVYRTRRVREKERRKVAKDDVERKVMTYEGGKEGGRRRRNESQEGEIRSRPKRMVRKEKEKLRGC
jgi:hypothetical protein